MNNNFICQIVYHDTEDNILDRGEHVKHLFKWLQDGGR